MTEDNKDVANAPSKGTVYPDSCGEGTTPEAVEAIASITQQATKISQADAHIEKGGVVMKGLDSLLPYGTKSYRQKLGNDVSALAQATDGVADLKTGACELSKTDPNAAKIIEGFVRNLPAVAP